ncbi:MAG: peptidylprolyl isomerase [Gammaproteobacteria bacterium]|nr:peptidylprolyl isomerase [Gammaproteobacteria bacterium]
MMESLRNFLTGPRLIFVVMVCALPFVFLGTSSLSSVFTGSFGSINGEDVTESDIQIAANTAVQRFKNVYGEDFNFEDLDDNLQSESIKQELIVQKVLQSQARALGFINKTSNKEAQKGIIRTPQFQVDGKFNEDVYQAQVNSNGFTKEGYLNKMAELYASEIYRNSLSQINFATPEETRNLAILFEQTTDIDFIKVSFKDLENQIENTLQELLDYYEANQINFYTNEKRGFKYFLLEQTDYKDAVNVPENYIDLAYKDYVEKFEKSAEIRFAHIMIDKNNYSDTSAALDVIKLVQSKLNDGEEFDLLASQYSEDLVTKDQGGDLEYFEKDIFPIEFEEAIESMGLNNLSEIIELDDTYHILKVTEYVEQKPIPEEQIKEDLLNDLIETESFALMNDDFSMLDDMLVDESSIEEIANSISKELISSDLYSELDYNFDISNPMIKEYIFANETSLNQPMAIEIGDKVIFISLDRIEEPVLKEFDMVVDSVGDLLSEAKAIEKIYLLQEELISIKDSDEKDSFINSYSYISEESFVDVKRYSSLLPNEILRKVFNEKEGSVLNLEANNRDQYLVNILKFNQLSENDIDTLIVEYNDFSLERSASKMQQIINEDVFQSARVNLNDLIQF